MTRVVLDPGVRRRQLLEAAIRVFARKGYAATSVTDIIRAASVARGTFYLYFPGKKQIFLAVVDDYRVRLELLIKAVTERAGQVTAENCRERVRQNVRAWLEFFDRHREATKIVLREANIIDPEFERKRNEIRGIARAHLVKRFRWLQNAGLFRADLSPKAFSLFVMGMLDEVVSTYILPDKKPDLDWLADQWEEFEWRGVRPTSV